MMSLTTTPRRLLHTARLLRATGTTTSDLLSIFSATEDTAPLSAAQYSQPQQQKAKCKLAASNPALHGPSDANSFFVVDAKEEALVKDVLLKRRRREEVQQHGFCSFLLRSHTMKAAQLLDTHENNTSLPRIFLTGKDGHGKSMALAYLSYRYWKKGWVILPVPSGARWVLDPQYIDMSTWKQGRVDSTRDAISWLNSFYKLNHDRVGKLCTTQQYTWLDGAYKTPEGTPVKELLSLIEEDDRASSDIVAVLLKELLASQDRPNVLLAVDDANGLFELGSYMVDENLRPIHAEEMTLVRAFRKVYRNHAALQRVGIVSATSTFSGVLSELNDEARAMLMQCQRVTPDLTHAPTATIDGTESGAEEALAAAQGSTEAGEDAAVATDAVQRLSASLGGTDFKIAYGVASDQEVLAFLDYHNSIGWCNVPSSAKTAKLLQSLSAGSISLLANHLRAW